MPGLWSGFVRRVGSLADYAAAGILIIFAVWIIFYLISKQKDSSSFIWLAVLACIYAFGLSRLRLAIERVHFIEYGLLAVFLFRALRHNIKNRSVYLWSGITVFTLGLIDEGIQYLLPNRVYDNRDVIVNGLAGILALLLIGLCWQPKFERLNERNR
ncbi:VanZ family protein [Candidatus Omnitrophota bacterium]